MPNIIFYQKELDNFLKDNNLRFLREIKHDGAYILYNGKKMLNLSSNDYLGVCANPALQKEFFEQLDVGQYSTLFGISSSRLLTGNHFAYQELEKNIADVYHKEACLVFNSGWHANTGIIPAICAQNDLILADKLVHASIIDGIRLSRATSYRYRHLDFGHLEKLLQTYRDKFKNVFIISESLFSMDGDIADLLQLISLKEKYSAFLYIDEAHAIGIRGDKGLGCCEEQACTGKIDIIIGTFSKALASQGAFIACNNVLREYLINTARSFIFSTALPPISLLWTIYILKKLPNWNEKRLYVKKISEKLKKELQLEHKQATWDSHIIPYIVGDNKKCIILAESLQESGFFVLPIRPPTVPEGTARIRLSLNAAISEQNIDIFINNLATLLK